MILSRAVLPKASLDICGGMLSQCWHLVYVGGGQSTQECFLHIAMRRTHPCHEEFSHFENSKQVAVFSTTLGGTIHLRDEHNLHNHQAGPGLDSDLVGKTVYNELS